MKSGFWQIQIAKADRYKTAFTVPFGHYEWNVMPFGLKKSTFRISKYNERYFYSVYVIYYCLH